jgi:hypothetical protein
LDRLFRLSRRIAVDSAQRELLVELGQRLDAHYQTHKTYPKSPGELPAPSWPDGSSPATLRSFRFESDGASFTLSCTSAYDGSVFTMPGCASLAALAAAKISLAAGPHPIF